MTISLDGMTSSELKQLQKQVSKAITKALKTEAKEAEKAKKAALKEAQKEQYEKIKAAQKIMAEAAKEAGVPLEELLQGVPSIKTGKKRGPVAPKYFNPSNPDEKWTGRGKKPKWFTAALEEGTTEEQMAL